MLTRPYEWVVVDSMSHPKSDNIIEAHEDSDLLEFSCKSWEVIDCPDPRSLLEAALAKHKQCPVSPLLPSSSPGEECSFEHPTGRPGRHVHFDESQNHVFLIDMLADGEDCAQVGQRAEKTAREVLVLQLLAQAARNKPATLHAKATSHAAWAATRLAGCW
eukprot:EG_transcript_10826